MTIPKMIIKPTYQELENRIEDLESEINKFKSNQNKPKTVDPDQIRKQLTEVENHSRKLLEISPVCTKIVDLDFNLRYMSTAGIKDLKIDDITEYYGKPYPFQFYPDSFKIPMLNNLRRVKETGEIITQEASVVDTEGRQILYHSSLVPFNDENGRLDYIMIVSLDITAKKKAEVEIKLAEKKAEESEKSFHSLFENMTSAYVFSKIILENGKPVDFLFLDVNKAFERLTGLKNVIGKKESDVVPNIQQSDSEMIEIVGRVAMTGKSEQVEYHVKALDKWFNTSIYSPQKGYFVSINEDITEKKRYEIELQNAKKKLIQINISLEEKINERTLELEQSLEREREAGELKSKFVAIASHEFRTPLTTIKNCANIISNFAKTEHQENLVRQTHRIQSSVGNLTTILNEFLTIGKLEEGGLEVRKNEMNIIDLTQSSITSFESITKKGQLILYKHEGDSIISTDKNLLQGILQNLLSNAIKYSSKDIELKTKVSNGEFTLSVKDSGIGIPQEEQDKIFSKFFRANNSSDIQGTGLGLNIVQQYVQLLNGKVEFTSACEKETIFTVSYPAK